MRAVIVIPARMAATRLPGKPLLSETGKPLIQHTWEQAKRAKRADRVIVATDDAQIIEAVHTFGGEAVMTRADHENGTSRVAEVAAGLDADIVVNVQGDEPEIEPDAIDALIDLQARSGAFCSTLACPFPADALEGPGSPLDPSCVKVVTSSMVEVDEGRARWALYFTRALAPFPRASGGAVVSGDAHLLHLGIYAFSRASVQAAAALPMTPLARTESLEQLKILEAGERIAVGLVDRAAPGVDTPADYAAFVARYLRKV